MPEAVCSCLVVTICGVQSGMQPARVTHLLSVRREPHCHLQTWATLRAPAREILLRLAQDIRRPFSLRLADI